MNIVLGLFFELMRLASTWKARGHRRCDLLEVVTVACEPPGIVKAVPSVYWQLLLHALLDNLLQFIAPIVRFSSGVSTFNDDLGSMFSRGELIIVR